MATRKVQITKHTFKYVTVSAQRRVPGSRPAKPSGRKRRWLGRSKTFIDKKHTINKSNAV